MRPRLHIVLSSKQLPGVQSQASVPGFWDRFRLLLISLAFAVLAIAVLIAAFILGSAIAAVLAVLLVIAVAVVLVKTALMRARRPRT
jgi:hypothetical protein